jgi:hypothetical protein
MYTIQNFNFKYTDGSRPNNIRQIGSNNLLKSNCRTSLLWNAIIQQIISMKNSVILVTNKQIYRISYIYNNFKT